MTDAPAADPSRLGRQLSASYRTWTSTYRCGYRAPRPRNRPVRWDGVGAAVAGATSNHPGVTTATETHGVLTRLKARMLLSECTGRDIWPVVLCRQKGIPPLWIEELSDCFESGFRSDRQTIYYEQRAVNQFHGVHDLQLAYRLGEFLGVDTRRVTAGLLDPAAQVRAVQEAVDED